MVVSPRLEMALVVAAPVLALLGSSAAGYARARTLAALLLLLGAGCLLVVVLTHVAEGLHLFPSMDWGAPRSVGHYLDLASATLGITLIIGGCLLYISRRINRVNDATRHE